MARSDKVHVDEMVAGGLLDILKENLSDLNPIIVSSVLFALSNVVYTATGLKQQLQDMGVYDMALHQFHALKSDQSIREAFAWFISSAFRGATCVNAITAS